MNGEEVNRAFRNEIPCKKIARTVTDERLSGADGACSEFVIFQFVGGESVK